MPHFTQIPEMPAEFLESLSKHLPSWEIHFEKEHLSTQIMASEAFKSGSDSRAMFLVRTQLSGRGRGDRGWVSSSDGRDITMTLLIPVDPSNENVALMSIIGGLSVVEALREITGHQFGVKWPNDIFYESDKVGGIISELLVSGSRRSVAMGIGMNVNSHKEDFVGVNSFYGINSVSSIVGAHVDLRELLVSVVKRLESNLNLMNEGMFEELKNMWGALEISYGKKIRYREIDGQWTEGFSAGITPEGYLAVVDENGNLVRKLVEGDVVPVE